MTVPDQSRRTLRHGRICNLFVNESVSVNLLLPTRFLVVRNQMHGKICKMLQGKPSLVEIT